MKNKEDFEKEQEARDRKRREEERREGDANRDPISGEPGAHPIGVAAGGTGGAVAGAAVGGAIGGPIGAAIGGVVGAVAGGAGGKLAAEAVNPTEEDRYWRQNYQNRPYYKKGYEYNQFEPAYRYGWETASKPEYANRNFEDIESNLQKEWPTYRGDTQTEWSEARFATKDSYDRVRSRFQGKDSLRNAESTAEQFGQDVSSGARNAGEYARDKSSSIWDQVKGNWKQFKGAIKEKWNDLTDDEIDQMEGRKERIIGKIQEKYGESKWKEADIERELRSDADRRF